MTPEERHPSTILTHGTHVQRDWTPFYWHQHRPPHIATPSITLRSWSHLPLRTDSDSID
jgi:hypothetical protein